MVEAQERLEGGVERSCLRFLGSEIDMSTGSPWRWSGKALEATVSGCAGKASQALGVAHDRGTNIEAGTVLTCSENSKETSWSMTARSGGVGWTKVSIPGPEEVRLNKSPVAPGLGRGS